MHNLPRQLLIVCSDEGCDADSNFYFTENKESDPRRGRKWSDARPVILERTEKDQTSLSGYNPRDALEACINCLEGTVSRHIEEVGRSAI